MSATNTPSWFGKLLTELIDIISSGTNGTMSRAKAEMYRLELMNGRSVFIQECDFDILGKVSICGTFLFTLSLLRGSPKSWVSANAEVLILGVLVWGSFTSAA